MTSLDRPEAQPPDGVTSSAPLFDPEAAMRIMGGDWDLFWTIADLFIDGWTDVEVRFRVALRDRDAEEIRQAAHYLKGGSSNVGATRVRELSARLETRAAQGMIADADEWVAAIRTAMQGYIDALSVRR